MGNDASGKKGQLPVDWRDIDYETLMKRARTEVRFCPRGYQKDSSFSPLDVGFGQGEFSLLLLDRVPCYLSEQAKLTASERKRAEQARKKAALARAKRLKVRGWIFFLRPSLEQDEGLTFDASFFKVRGVKTQNENPPFSRRKKSRTITLA